MPYRKIPLVNNEFYHVYNRGVEKRRIFIETSDYCRFLNTLIYYNDSSNPVRYCFAPRGCNISNTYFVEIIAYCLMPNHYHLIVKQVDSNGISKFISKVSNSYTKYFNAKNDRVGPLFQGPFKAKRVLSDEQLIHLSRYIHLNPYSSNLIVNPIDYKHSSLSSYLNNDNYIKSKYILTHFENIDAYKKFILDYKEIDKTKKIIRSII